MIKLASGIGRVGLGGRSTIVSLEEVLLRLGGVVLWRWLVPRETGVREESVDLCLSKAVEWLMVDRVTVNQFISVRKRRQGEAGRR
jgi:hypothetical protein